MLEKFITELTFQQDDSFGEKAISKVKDLSSALSTLKTKRMKHTIFTSLL